MSGSTDKSCVGASDSARYSSHSPADGSEGGRRRRCAEGGEVGNQGPGKVLEDVASEVVEVEASPEGWCGIYIHTPLAASLLVGVVLS